MTYQNRTICIDKREIVVDRYHTIGIVTRQGRVIQVDGLPEDWDYTVHDVDQDTDEYYI